MSRRSSASAPSRGFFDEVYPYIKDSFKLHKYYKGDELCFDTAEYLIGKYQPDVMYLHLVCIDYLRHNYGVFSKELWTGYEYLDKGFARILKALKDQGLENRTIINVTSDHGHLDIRRVYSINRFLAGPRLYHRGRKRRACGLDRVLPHLLPVRPSLY